MKNKQCQELHDMKKLIIEQRETARLKEIKRKRINYEANKEKMKRRRLEYYAENSEKEKNYNREYHKQNRESILPKMRLYNKSYQPRRRAIKKFKRKIQQVFNKTHGNPSYFSTDIQYHMYYHTQGKCDLRTLAGTRHRIDEEYESFCPMCDCKLYKALSFCKVFCVNVQCQTAYCLTCKETVSVNPMDDFKHFYIHSGMVPGLCPLFENSDLLCLDHPCSDEKSCISTEASMVKFDDYLQGSRDNDSFLPRLPCKLCKEVKKNIPELTDKCLKVQQFNK